MEEPTIEPLAVRFETAARILDCSVASVRRMVKHGTLKTMPIPTGRGKREGDKRVTMRSIKRLAGSK